MANQDEERWPDGDIGFAKILVTQISIDYAGMRDNAMKVQMTFWVEDKRDWAKIVKIHNGAPVFLAVADGA